MAASGRRRRRRSSSLAVAILQQMVGSEALGSDKSRSPVVDGEIPGIPTHGAGIPTHGAGVPELTTVADDFAVVFNGPQSTRYDDLEPDTVYEFDGIRFRTLSRPGGELLARVAAVNDVHFGETICGYESNMPDAGP